MAGESVDTSTQDGAVDGRPEDASMAQRSAAALTPPRVVGLAPTETGAYASVMHLTGVASVLAMALTVPVRRARAVVLERIRGDIAPLFVAEGSDELAEAAAVSEAHEWRPALRDGYGVWVQYLGRQERARQGADVFVLAPDMEAEEVLWRGMPLEFEPPYCGWWFRSSPGVTAAQKVHSLPALPALHGRAGALEAFAVATAPGADRADVPFVAKAQALAIFETDARRIFPEVFATTPGQAVEVRPLRQVQAGRESVAVEPDMNPSKRPGEKWKDSDRALLAQQHRWLTVDGPNLMKSEAADEQLGERWKISASNVKQNRLKAPRPGVTAANTRMNRAR